MKIQHKIKCYVFIIALSFLCVSKAYASLEITEIMYDPKGSNDSHQWIEVYNNGPDLIDLSSWSITDYDTTWHFRSIISDSLSNLESNSYAIIAKTSNLEDFKTKNPNLSGQILRANITLLADKGELGLSSDKKNIISEVAYSSLMNDGNSLQKINGDWVASIPTPGGENVLNNNTQDEDNTEDTTTTTTIQNSSIISPSKEKVIVYPIETKIISQKTVMAGLAFLINSETFGTKKEEKILGRFVWNFGDGNMKEEAVSNPFEYIYEYPGDYILTLSYFDTHFSIVPEATARAVIKVVPSQMTISSVGDYTDPFIELENKSPYEINLSKWQILSSSHSFIFPEGMIVLPNKKLKLSPKVTGFNFNDLQSLTLKNPSSEIVFLYPQKKSYTSNTSSVNSNKKAPANLDDVNLNTNTDESNIINLNDLEASAVKSSMNLNINYYLVALFFVIGAGIASVLLLRKKNDIDHDGVEGPITANDIKIIE